MSSSSRDHAPTTCAVTSGQLEMLERVARALHRAHHEGGRRLYPNGAWDFLDRFERERWLFSARAAIEAMRDRMEVIFAECDKPSAYYDAHEEAWVMLRGELEAALQSAPHIEP